MNVNFFSILTVFAISVSGPALAFGKIERACNKSERQTSRSLCRCIQRVANSELTRSDRRLAAKFFKKPELAQEVRQSDNRTKEQFWKRYKAFGNKASQSCK